MTDKKVDFKPYVDAMDTHPYQAMGEWPLMRISGVTGEYLASLRLTKVRTYKPVKVVSNLNQLKH